MPYKPFTPAITLSDFRFRRHTRRLNSKFVMGFAARLDSAVDCYRPLLFSHTWHHHFGKITAFGRCFSLFRSRSAMA